jgi:outer membrane biosynthesis protein TonB
MASEKEAMKILISALLFIITSTVVAVEETEGMRAMRLGCEKQNLGLGCTNYANFLIKNGRESEADAYFEKGCKLGNQDGCDKKKWPVKEVVSPESEIAAETPVEPPIEAPVEEVITTPTEPVVPTEEVPSPIEETVPSPAE